MYTSRAARSLCRQAMRPAQPVLTYGLRMIATADWPINHDKLQTVTTTPNYIDNTERESSTKQWIDLHDPATNNLVTRVPESTRVSTNQSLSIQFNHF